VTEGRRAPDGRPGRLGGALAVPTGQVPAVRAGLASFGDASPDQGEDGAAPAPGRPRRRRLAFGARPTPISAVPAPSQGAWATPSVIVRRPDGSVVEPTGRGSSEAPRPGGRSAVPAYGAARRRPPAEPVVAGIVTATASGAASRAARSDGEAEAGRTDEGLVEAHAGESARRPGDAPAGVAAVGHRPGDAPANAAAAGPQPGEAAGNVAAADPEAPAAAAAPGVAEVAQEAEQAEVVAGKARTPVDAAAARTSGGAEGAGATGDAEDTDDQHDDGDATSDSGRTPAALRPLVSVGGTVASQATSAREGVIGALRVVRDVGTSRLLPTDPEAREALNARLRRAGTYVGAVAVACVLIYAVFPVRTYLDQRAATRRAHEQIEVISEQNDRLEERVEALGSGEEIERIAREEYGMVRPGEESYGILPPPDPSQTTTTTTTTAPTGASGGSAGASGATSSTTVPKP
jgi:cell division protein FtsB